MAAAGNTTPSVGARDEAREQLRAQQQDTLFYNFLALVLGLAAVTIVYLVLSFVYRLPPLDCLLGVAADRDLPWPAAVLISRSVLQPLNMCLFGFGLAFLGLRWWLLRHEFQAFAQPFLNGLPRTPQGELVITAELRQAPLENVRQIAREHVGTLPLLVRRLDVGSRRLAGGGDVNQVLAVMQALGQIDRDATEGRYTLVRYLIWLIPTIGFLGTVVGIGQAISGFTGVMAELSQGTGDLAAQLPPLLGQVARDLGIAFDTTVLALLLSAIVVALTSMMQTREEALLSAIDDYCLCQFANRISVSSGDSGMMQQALVMMAQTLQGQQQGGDEEGQSWRDVAGLMTAQLEQLKGLQATMEKIRQSLNDRHR